MSGTIRSRMEAQRDRHEEFRWPGTSRRFDCCNHCHQPWPCPDRVAADDTLTDLNNANRWPNPDGDDPIGNPFRLIPDPEESNEHTT